ncbi:aminoglycoside nucleotidyltransferase ANT(6)-Ig [Campylobacter coli]|nr:aminoglycoside 6-adenylyltransferase AadE-Cc [Campylobacter coli]EAK4419803.1 aminoglycoside 6-adenylyltransferase AadE-Cc [Campylobacter coli]EJP1640987.1 aminoglycoside 6-adenylyltransferase AadE-Cc [Campylobacter coli]EJP1641083.1 aminoglycoside 6-adenylyltransferase AadE-Cc [Campylobacter coli]
MQNQDKFLKQFKKLALLDKNIRLVTLEGSRVNKKAKKDKYQDYDISFFVPLDKMKDFLGLNEKQNFNECKNLPKCILELEKSSYFKKILMLQMPECMEFYPPDLPQNWISFLVLFESGVRLDLTIIPLEDLKNYYEFEPLSQALLDKNGLFTHTILKAPFSITHLSQRSFDDVCNEFYFLYSCLKKALLRKQFILSNHLLNSLRKALFDLLSFKIGLNFGFEIWLGKEYTNILEFLEEKEVKIILKSFNTATLEHIKKARKKLEILFHKNAKFVAKKSDFKLFPYRKNVKRYCKILGKL